jgi:hypothetical protein
MMYIEGNKYPDMLSHYQLCNLEVAIIRNKLKLERLSQISSMLHELLLDPPIPMSEKETQFRQDWFDACMNDEKKLTVSLAALIGLRHTQQPGTRVYIPGNDKPWTQTKRDEEVFGPNRTLGA